MYDKRQVTWMGVAITLLITGIFVQLADNLELFGKNSVFPLIWGAVVFCVGLICVFLLRWYVGKRP